MVIDDGILIATYKAGLKMTIDDAKHIVNERLKLLEGKSLPVLIIDSGVVSMDKSARDFYHPTKVSADSVQQLLLKIPSSVKCSLIFS